MSKFVVVLYFCCVFADGRFLDGLLMVQYNGRNFTLRAHYAPHDYVYAAYACFHCKSIEMWYGRTTAHMYREQVPHRVECIFSSANQLENKKMIYWLPRPRHQIERFHFIESRVQATLLMIPLRHSEFDFVDLFVWLRWWTGGVGHRLVDFSIWLDSFSSGDWATTAVKSALDFSKQWQ